MNILDIAIQAESGVSNLARAIGVAPNVIGNWKKRKVPKAWGQVLSMKYGQEARPLRKSRTTKSKDMCATALIQPVSSCSFEQ